MATKQREKVEPIKRRKRVRKVGQSSASKTVPSLDELISEDDAEKLKELMVTCAEQNELMNMHKKTYDATRKELLALLQSLDKSEYSHPQAEVNGRKVSLDAVIKTPVQRAIDIDKFHKAVDEDTFKNCVTIALGTAEAEAGANIVNQCAYNKDGTTNVTVKAKARK
tara:strand:+ start:252 stop:752 length:501 start_codon:yes stop_codon:yes gene_type:complete